MANRLRGRRERLLKTQQERYTFEMLLDAEWISWGRYYMRRDAVNGNKYWDEHGNEITVAQSTARAMALMQLKKGIQSGKAL